MGSQKRNKGFLVPSVINPPNRRCVKIWIPDEITHIANFWGVLNFLTLWTEYERTGNTDGAETANVWKEVYLSARQYFELGECELPLQLRTQNGMIEWRPDPLSEWQSLGEVCPCPSVIPAPQYNPDGGTFDQRACNIAVNLLDWLMAKYNDSIDAVEAAADTVAAFDVIILIFGPGYIVADQLLDAINEFIEVGVNAARAFDTEIKRDAMKQFLYCAMRATGEMSEAIWEDFREFCADEWNNISNPAFGAFNTYTAMFDVDALLARARIESYEESDCTEFNCDFNWEQDFNFELEQSLLDWETISPYSTPNVTTSGLQPIVRLDTSGNPDVSDLRVYIKKNLTYADGTTRILQVSTYWSGGSIGNSTTSPAAFTYPRVRLNESANIASAGDQPLTLPDGNATQDFLTNPTILDTYYLVGGAQFGRRLSNTAQPVTATGNIRRIIVRGNGKNPFIV